jgi:capsular polysaccharide export protein
MRQNDLASATAPASRNGGSRVLTAPFIAARERPALAALLPDFTINRHPPRAGGERSSAIIASLDSRDQARARRRADALGVPFLLLGSGVLRAPPGWAGAASKLSVTAHSMTGPGSPADFFDPHRLLASRGWESSELSARAAAARRDIVSRRLGGAWWNSGTDPGLPRCGGLALVVASEANGPDADEALSATLLREMLAAALAENAPHQVVLLAPGAGRFRPLGSALRDAAACGCTVVTRPTDSWEAIERAGCVYAAAGETGFLALLAGVQVRCFADSFYSGWGITADAGAVPPKPFGRTVDEVFAGACFLATRYLDPYRLKTASIEDTLEIVAEWRKIETANRRVAVCVGMSFWKRRQVSDFLRSTAGKPAFRRTARAALATARTWPGSTIAVWASRIPAGLEEAAERHAIPLIRVEDGFVRSVGLGSDFMPAASLVLDGHGMHFDPKVHSDLDRLLVETEFDPALIERAHQLIGQLVTRGVTKYNLGKAALSIEWPAGKRRILVPGQVEDDLSVRLGGEGILGNLDLLARVRAANPDAFILYKPHPDVEAGHRKGRIRDEVARNYADIVIREVSTAALLAQIDELHTLTSLAGFEALLRGRRVVVYGRPFYAGWGLTADLAKIDRGRRLALEELVAGALILYPRYLDPVTRLPCGPELVIERLEDPELWRPGPLVLARRLQGLLVRRWGELAANIAKLPAGAFQPFRRDGPRTPQIW